jgi:succinate-acetate transporter protein
MADSQNNAVPFSNPFSFGVMGLAVAAFALASVLMGYAGTGTAAFIPWAIMFGGFAQLIGGLIDLRNKSILGGTALSLYGLLWISLGIEFILKGAGWEVSAILGGNVDIMLLLMSLGFTYGFASTNLITFLILVEIDFVFVGLFLHKLGIVHGAWLTDALGVIVYIIGICAWYAATAFLLNTHYGKKILPMGPALIKK